MSTHTYDWQRFWYERGTSINVHLGGYLQNPDNSFGYSINKNAKPFSAIADIPCLCLLAEPGMGKSHTIELEERIIKSVLSAQGDYSIFLNLNAFGNEERLIRELFESREFQNWLEGDYKLHIFLDSLDEGIIQIKVLAQILIKQFKKCPIDRLYLRIACRSADWPIFLEEDLRKVWGENNIGIFELAPLRLQDVKLAAQVNGADAELFCHEIHRMQAVPLAIKPVTLKMLLNIYQTSGKFPNTQIELYEKGCIHLCAERNTSRSASQQFGYLSPEGRMEIAGRIAVVTLFSNKHIIWTDIDTGNIPEGAVKLSELQLPKENHHINNRTLNETLSTSLFSTRGPYEIVWAHYSYAEFLAAWYLKKQGIALTQYLDLLIYKGDDAGKLVPQLRGVGAWIASLEPDIMQELMHRDPELLLRSDINTLDNENRVHLLNQLLGIYNDNIYPEYSTNLLYKLNHPSIAEQLRPYIIDKNYSLQVREAAIDIAHACNINQLLPELLSIMQDDGEYIRLKMCAIDAVATIGDENSKKKLKDLLLSSIQNDELLQVKGQLLQILWPKYLTTNELLSLLTPPNFDFFGQYEMFLKTNFTSYIPNEDLPLALDWITNLPSEYNYRNIFEPSINNIFQRSWLYLENNEILQAFARAAYSRLKDHDPIISLGDPNFTNFNQEVTANKEKRYLLIKTILPFLKVESYDSLCLLYSTPLLATDDIPWLLEELVAQKNTENQYKLAQLIERLFVANNFPYFDIIYSSCQENLILSITLDNFLKGTQLENPETKELRKSYYRRLKIQEKQEEQKLINNNQIKQIESYLSQIENGDIESWWILNKAMSPHTNHNSYDYLEIPIHHLPIWNEYDNIVKSRIIEAARHHIVEKEVINEDWLDTNQYPEAVFASYNALYLLEQEDRSFLEKLPVTVWEKWIPIIYGHISNYNNDDTIHQNLLIRAYKHARGKLLSIVSRNIYSYLRSNNLIYIPYKLNYIWDNDIAQILLAIAQDENVPPQAAGIIFDQLFKHNYKPVYLYTESLISLKREKNSTEWQRAVIATHRLLIHNAYTAWNIIYQSFQEDALFGHEVITYLTGSGYPHVDHLTVLSASQLANFYIWLEQQFPHKEDPLEISSSITTRKGIAIYRDGVLGLLRQKNTITSCQEIQRIIACFPHLESLKHILHEAWQNVRQANWIAPTPEEILQLCQDKRYRLVQNGDDLINILQETLRKLEEELQGEIPAVIDLWNYCEKKYSPKDENTFSDYVSRFLSRELGKQRIVVNREVVIRQGTGQRDGERTDIYVNAIAENEDVIRVIIEVKKCNNTGILAAMEEQLTLRYLKDNNNCRHGLYLVGWFYCEQWKKTVPKEIGSLQKLQEKLDEQAILISSRYQVNVKACVLNTAIR